MSRVTGLLAIICCLSLALLVLSGTGWSDCTSYYYCDTGDAVRAGSAAIDKSGVYGYNDGGGYGVFGRSFTGGGCGVGGAAWGSGPGVWGYSFNGWGVRGDSDNSDAIRGQANSSTSGSGVVGTALGGYGVIGTSSSNDGVRGVSGSATKSGVSGTSTVGGYGVTGHTGSGGNTNVAGVWGINDGSGPGVSGTNNASGPGVKGNSSTGNAGYFEITNTASTTAALVGENAGSGPAVSGHTLNTGPGVKGASWWGNAGYFENVNTVNTNYALVGKSAGSGAGVYGTSDTGNAGFFQITNASNNFAAFRMETAGTGYGAVVRSLNAATTNPALYSQTVGQGKAGEFIINNVSNNMYAVSATTNGTGWAGCFTATGLASRGVYIKTNGGTGLMVSGGTKSAVVPTSKGERSLYAEEASEVYFTDYGFGKLKEGKAVIAIDPLFAETVNLHQSYHVFTQAYGQAELVVTKRTPTAFEVCLRDKDTQGDANAEFSYRLVAKRQGFETARLEATPCPSESDLGMQPEKPGEKMAALTMP